jgi:ferritin-like metal-binding protein YciE
MPEPSAASAKLIQYLNEAYATEKRLETALQAHISMTTRAPYKKRLKEHLADTKRHAREVKQRIKQLGGVAETVSVPVPEPVTEVAQTVLSGAQKAVALAQGPLHALRGTGEEEKQLKNAKTEYASESEEIATYTAIETLAAALKDRDTERLARSIRRDEERMRSFLEREIPRLTKEVVKAEIPASQRRNSPAKTPVRARPTAKKPSTAPSRVRSTTAKTKTAARRAPTKARSASKAKAPRAKAK